MLQDMWDACVVWRVSLETHGEDIVLVISGHMQVLCSCVLMFQMERRQLQLGNILDTLKPEAMEPLSRFWQTA